MKRILTIAMLLTSSLALSVTNLSDAIDANEVPAEIEEREEEVINKPDAIDKNTVPSHLEERQKEEEWREDYDSPQYDTIKRQNKMRPNEGN